MGMLISVIGSLRRLEDYLGESKAMMRNCIILSFVATVALYTTPYICGMLFDALISENPPEWLDLNALIDVLTVTVLIVIMWYAATSVSKRKMTLIALAATKRIREEMNVKVMRLPISFIDETSSGDLTARFTSDLPAVGELISNDYNKFIVHSTMVVSVIIMMIASSPILAVVYIALIPLVMLVVRRLTKISEQDFYDQKRKIADLNSRMSNLMTVQRTIKTENLEGEFMERFSETNKDFRESFIRTQTRAGMIQPMVSLATNSGYFITVIVGAILIFYHHLDAGMFMAFMIYVRMVNSPLLMTTTVFNSLRDRLMSLDRVMDVLHAEEDENLQKDGEDMEIKGAITFDHVSFSYPNGNKVLKDISFEIRPGEMTVLAGPTGSGKTTVANLLLEFYTPESGTIRIDGVDYLDISKKSRSDAIAAVLQYPWVFDGSIRENIVYNREDIDEDTFKRVCSMTGLDEYVARLPKGYDIVIGDDLRPLPLAQTRMLAMSRAFMGEPRVLLLDEAIAGVDSVIGRNIIEGLRKNIKDHTIIIISHNRALMDSADHVIYLEDGMVVKEERR